CPRARTGARAGADRPRSVAATGATTLGAGAASAVLSRCASTEEPAGPGAGTRCRSLAEAFGRPGRGGPAAIGPEPQSGRAGPCTTWIGALESGSEESGRGPALGAAVGAGSESAARRAGAFERAVAAGGAGRARSFRARRRERVQGGARASGLDLLNRR